MMESWSKAVRSLEPVASSPDSRTKLYHMEWKEEPVIVKQVICDDEDTARNLISRSVLGLDPQSLKSMHIIAPLASACEKRLGGGYYATIVIPLIERSLTEDVEERCWQKVKYSEEVLWKYLKDLVNALAFLQANRAAIRNLSLEHIFVNKNEDVFVVYIGSTLGTNESFESALEHPFLSPKLREALLLGVKDLKVIDHNMYKSDLYSLGVVMLILTTLERPMLLNLEDLQSNINQIVEDITDYSQQWKEALSLMLTVSEANRPDFIQISTYLTIKMFPDDEAFEELKVDDVAEPLKLTVRCGLSYARMSAERSDEVPFLISLKTDGSEGTKRMYSLDLVCAIDVSGSMEGERLFEVQCALIDLVGMMTCRDRVSIVTFSDFAKRESPLIVCSESGQNTLRRCIQELKCIDLTNITEGFRCALNVLMHRRYKNSFSAVLLFTDGKHNTGDPLEDCEKDLESSSIENLSVFCVGMGKDLNTQLLINLAVAGNGLYIPIENLKDIHSCFKRAFACILNTVARGITISLIPSETATVRYTRKEVYAQLGECCDEIILNDLEFGAEKDILIILQLEGRDLENGFGETIAYCVVSYKTNDGQSATCSTSLNVKFRKWQCAPPTQDKHVYEHLYRFKGAEYLDTALAYETNGDTEEAKVAITHGIEFLMAGLCCDFPLVKKVIADLEKVLSRLETMESCENLMVCTRYAIMNQVCLLPPIESSTQHQRRTVESQFQNVLS